ncbi:MAG: hypothetical protein FOGNACKC_00874 [Anaerolineae bacterium]|nr:hypothetical protein [Anaerolineae bacterium]
MGWWSVGDEMVIGDRPADEMSDCLESVARALHADGQEVTAPALWKILQEPPEEFAEIVATGLNEIGMVYQNVREQSYTPEELRALFDFVVPVIIEGIYEPDAL